MNNLNKFLILICIKNQEKDICNIKDDITFNKIHIISLETLSLIVKSNTKFIELISNNLKIVINEVNSNQKNLLKYSQIVTDDAVPYGSAADRDIEPHSSPRDADADDAATARDADGSADATADDADATAGTDGSRIDDARRADA